MGKNSKSKGVKKHLKKHRIDIDEKIPQPEAAYGILNETDGQFVLTATLGNLSLVTGKAKSRKSFFMAYVASALLMEKPLGRIEGRLPKNKQGVIYCDTEQSKHHCQSVLKRISKLSKGENKNRLHFYALRSLKPANRLETIELAIKHHKKEGIGFVIIDGIRDLVNSINSEEEATSIASWLLKLTEKLGIHILCVLHQNKSDNNARGHLGSELIHKSETVYSLAKDENNNSISVVKAEMCRNREPEVFAFEISDEGLPIEIEGYEERKPKKGITGKMVSLLNLPDTRKHEILTKIFSKEKEYKYTNLWREVKVFCEEILERKVGDNIAKNMVKHFRDDKGWLVQDKRNGPYRMTEIHERMEMEDEMPF